MCSLLRCCVTWMHNQRLLHRYQSSCTRKPFPYVQLWGVGIWYCKGVRFKAIYLTGKSVRVRFDYTRCTLCNPLKLLIEIEILMKRPDMYTSCITMFFFYPKDTAGSINCNSISSSIVIDLMVVFKIVIAETMFIAAIKLLMNCSNVKRGKVQFDAPRKKSTKYIL